MKANTTVWLILMMLTSLSFAVSETHGLRSVAPLILGVAGIKGLLVAAQFMELRRAHPVWFAGFAALVGTILAVVGLCVA